MRSNCERLGEFGHEKVRKVKHRVGRVLVLHFGQRIVTKRFLFSFFGLDAGAELSQLYWSNEFLTKGATALQYHSSHGVASCPL